MPVDYQQIQTQIREMGAKAPARKREREEKRSLAARLLGEYAASLEALNRRVDEAMAATRNLRCARPLNDPLNARFPLPAAAEPAVLLAADGSQINPSRHDAVEFGVINLGAVRFASGEIPSEFVRSELLYGDALYINNRRIPEEVLALRRDLRERTLLKELAAAEQGKCITLTDGPLELFREPKENAEFTRGLEEYIQVLTGLADMAVLTAGYVDKPRADLVVRLLELMALNPADLARRDPPRPLLGLTDLDLYGELLAPGERSAVFRIESTSREVFKGPLALTFFYLNVGREKHPQIARVELPLWAAETPARLESLHAHLAAQCRLTGAHPYPYLLHRAHEVAVVRLDERQKLESMIQMELGDHDDQPLERSAKQANKDLPGRTRYGK